MQHVFRAEKLATSTDEQTLATLRESGDLSGVRSEAGCNMLFVYLLRRWGSIFEPGAPAKIASSEELQSAVVDTYVALGCAVDEAVPSKHLHQHTGPAFRRMVQFKGKMSPLAFAELLLRELHRDMFPAVHAQLERLAARLRSHADGSWQAPVPRAPETTRACVTLGARTTADGDAELRALREAAEALGLAVLVAGDPPEGAAVEVVVGLELACADADDGAPAPVPDLAERRLDAAQARFLQSLGEVQTYLVASGPLASCSLVRGTPGDRDGGGEGRFVAGADMQQTPHAKGVRGEVVASADSTPRACVVAGGDLFLVVRYD